MMQASRAISTWTLGVPAGAWRWAALAFAIVALGAAGLALTQPDQAAPDQTHVRRLANAIRALSMDAVETAKKASHERRKTLTSRFKALAVDGGSAVPPPRRSKA